MQKPLFFGLEKTKRKEVLEVSNKNAELVPMERVKRSFDVFTDDGLIDAAGSILVFDVESYWNYFLVAFKCIKTNKVVYVEETQDSKLNYRKLRWIMWNFCVVGFNSRNYDVPIVELACTGKYSAWDLKQVTNEIIGGGLQPRDIQEQYDIVFSRWNHIDLFDVCPLTGSLKIYAGRLHCERLQDLPYDPDKVLDSEQIDITRLYCVNDLDNTQLIALSLSDQLTLRSTLGAQYGQDLRSKSDAQIAEKVIQSEIERITGTRVKRPTLPEGTRFRYQIPDFVSFQTPVLQQALDLLRTLDFELDGGGSPIMPTELASLSISVGKSVFKMGMGGLHSTEKCTAYKATPEMRIIDRDVESYYPNIVLNQRLYPKHLGEVFLEVYSTIVKRRVEAKKAKNNIVSDALKITINGTFGKLGSMHSVIYAPDLMIQVTLTGQLCLLMYIEMMEANSFQVISANTDGVVCLVDAHRKDRFDALVAHWEKTTSFKTEETEYAGLFSRDVNNYVAVKPDGKTKGKGAFSNPWNDPKMAIFRFHKNPQTTICIEAVSNILVSGKPLMATILECRDLSKFVSVRNVKGGAWKDGIYLGKTVRWYYGKGVKGTINYKLSGNKVPKSDGAKPCMDLPEGFPDDIDYGWYVSEATEMLYDLGYLKKAGSLHFFN